MRDIPDWVDVDWTEEEAIASRDETNVLHGFAHPRASVDRSDVHGMGSFAAMDIPEGEVAFLAFVPGPGGRIWRTPATRYINHSTNDNVVMEHIRGFSLFRAVSDIKEGDEILVDYRGLPWYGKKLKDGVVMDKNYLDGYMGKQASFMMDIPRRHLPSLSVEGLRDNVWAVPGLSDVQRGALQSSISFAGGDNRSYISESALSRGIAEVGKKTTPLQTVTRMAEGMAVASAFSIGAKLPPKVGTTAALAVGLGNVIKGTEMFNHINNRRW